ncbi:MAG: amidohydrolase family protein [Planctomycetes bacterium]|nr:amidohydrolase family protein [Planctomycetota bacterium]
MQIDAHQHFWRYNPVDYDWMTDEMQVLRRDHLPADLKPLLDAAGFDGSIVVQARRTIAETEWLLQLADAYPFVFGVVGWVDFESDQLDEQLERFSSHPKLKGVREVVQDLPVDYAASDTHVRGVGQLSRYGLTYDLLVKPPQLPAAIELVRQLPDQPFVLDHLGKPYIARKELSPWQDDLRELAKSPNVFCKLSGMVTEAQWRRWQPEDFHPYLEIVLEAFGPDRCMVGSDWPVCTLSGAYAEVIAIVRDYISRLSSSEQTAILGGTCQRFYRVDAAQTG